MSRRGILRGAAVGVAGLAGAALVGCGSDEESTSAPAGTAAGAAGTTAAAAGTAASAAPAMDAIARGGELVYGGNYDPPSLDPHFGTSGGEREWLHMPYDRLVNTNQAGLLDPSLSLAESWEQVDPLTVVLKLRPDVFIWKTDEAVDAELVKWNLERAKDPAATTRSALESVESVEVISPSELILHQAAISAPMLSNLTDRPGAIISRRQLEALGKEAFGRNPLGSGPFQIESWKASAQIVFVGNKDHWMRDDQGGQMPYLDKFTMNIIPDPTVMVAALESGESDLLAAPSDDYARLKEDSTLQLSEFVGSLTYQFYINHNIPPWDNEKWRKGFSHAMDRESYIKNFLKGHEPLGRGLLTPASWAWDDTIEGDMFDLQKARDLLGASGIPEAEWTPRIQPIGQSVTTSDEFWVASGAKAGIKFQLAQAEPGSYATRVLTGLGGDGSAGAFWSSWSMRLDPDANIGDFYMEKASYNAGQYPVPELEPLVIKARETLEPEERKAIYSEIQRYAVEHTINSITLMYAINSRFGSKRVGNLEKVFGGEGKERFYWLYNKEA